MALGWNRLGRAPGHGNRAKEHVTEWTPPTPPVDGLIWFLLSHIHFPFFSIHLSLTGWVRVLKVCASTFLHTHARVLLHQSTTVAVLAAHLPPPPHPHTPPRLFISFQHALFTPPLEWAPDHTPATACDPEQMFPLCVKAMLWHLQLYSAHCFWKQPKNKWHHWSAFREINK